MRAEEHRIRKLQATGRITRREADQMVAALQLLERRSASARARATRYRRDLTALGALKARFLVGQITRAELSRGLKRVAIALGVTMACSVALMMLLLHGLELDGPRYETWGEQSVFALVYGGILGVLTGSAALQRLRAQVRGLARLRRRVDIALPSLAERAPGRCPSCGSERHQPAWLKALASAGWVLMPWIAIHELYLGQRLPRQHERCMSCGAIYVECSHCEASVENLDWTRTEPAWASEGLHCARCRVSIPCWRNAFALLLQWPVRASASARGR